MNFNQKLLKLRKSNGMSQEELGNHLDVSRQTVSKWELGDTTPEMDKLIQLSNLFNISLDELIKGSTNNEVDVVINKSSKKGVYDILYLALKIFGILIIVEVIIMVIYFIINGFPR